MSGVAMPLDRGGAQGASQQSLILHHGKAKNTLVLSGLQALSNVSEMPPHAVRPHRFRTPKSTKW
jgi:hypothetical protein